MKSTSSRNSESSTQFDSPHSPLRFRTSPLSDIGDPFHSPENTPETDHRDNNSRAIVIIDTSTQYSNAAPSLPNTAQNEAPRVAVNRAVRTEPPPPTMNQGPKTIGARSREDGGGRVRPVAAVAVSKREVMARKVALGFRLSEVVLCLISFSVMAADKTQGWSGDSFDRYKEWWLY